ncbi:RxLR effector protein [Phytophthora megakarya]|uniref:RxLR effector protein n=1 Tax=Phytophthora megakarya TaxID=4795 RepID=A0A225VZ77_9STRA|nr:RxLR effector protein [Phytophthora megakarya]
MVVKLTEQYGDKELASILAAAKEVPETRYVAVNLLRAQMEKWLTQKKDVGDVFRYLKLDEAKYDLLASPVLTRWMAFVDRSYQKSYDVLNGHLSRFDDQGLANFLVGAKGGVAFGRFDYHKVENPILQKWVDAKKSADDVYGLLKLREVEASDFMQSPALATWLTYVTKVDHRFFNLHHGPYELLYKQLIKQYDDTELANILLGPKGEFWKGFHVYKLDDMILEKWKKSGKSADEVYDLLKLRNVEAKDLLQNPALVIWMSFVTRLNRRSHHPYAVLYNRLNADLGNSKLVELIRDAKYGGHTRAMRMAEKLEKEQRIHAASIAKNVRR